jgi:hypothetical protein
LNGRFLSSHRLVPWTHFHHNRRLRPIGLLPSVFTSRSHFASLLFLFSTAVSHITSRQHRESRQFDVETLSAVVVVPAPIPAESPAPPTSYHQSGTRALSQRLRYRRHHDPRGLGGSWQAASIKHPPQSVVHWARRLFSDPQIGAYPFPLGEHRSSFEVQQFRL